HRELFPFWPRSADFPVGEATAGSADRKVGATSGQPTPQPVATVTARVAEMLEQRGASFLIDLALATGIDSRDVATALWELIWRGQVTHDQWSVIRAGPPAGRPAEPAVRPAVPGRLPGHAGPSRWPRPSIARRGVFAHGG